MTQDPTRATLSAVDRARAIQWMLFDVDGILTDGSLWYGPDGEQVKRFHSLDGHGLKMLRQSGVRIGLLSGRDSQALRYRAKELGFDAIMLGIADKRPVWEAFLAEQSLPPSACGYMGDDVVDLPVLRRAGFAATVKESPPIVQQHCDWTAQWPAGMGAVRELCDWLLQARGSWESAMQAYLD